MNAITEKEAKGKWCPMVSNFKSGTITPACNRVADGKKPPEWSMCLGSECMAWRWYTAPVADRTPTPEEDAANEGTGYCGMAGR